MKNKYIRIIDEVDRLLAFNPKLEFRPLLSEINRSFGSWGITNRELGQAMRIRKRRRRA